MLRLFVGAVLPAAARDDLSGVLGPLRSALGDAVSWTRPTGWHVTLAFIGRVPAEVGPVVDEVAAAVARDWPGPPAVAVTTTDVAVLGRGAVAIALRDEPEGAFADLGEQLQVALAAADVPVARRPVRPHVTVARARRGRDVRGVDGMMLDPVGWDADGVQVVTSHLGDGPARYEVRSNHPFVAG